MQLTPDSEKKILAESGAHTENLLTKPNVHVYFPGEKVCNGHPTGESCIVVGVSQKTSEEHLSSEDIIPSVLSSGVKTDVIEIPPIYAGGWCSKTYNPVGPPVACGDHVYNPETNLPYFNFPGGISIGNATINDASTLGVMVRDRTTRELVGLATNHGVGLKPYIPGPNNPVIDYNITDNGLTFILTNLSTGVSAVSAKIENNQSAYHTGSFDNLIAGNLYKFISKTNLHDFYISTGRTDVNGGGALDPYTGITIYDIAGDIRYVNGQGTGTPSISSGEVMYVTIPADFPSLAVYYGSWLYPNIGNNIDITYIGVPPCKSTNYNKPPPSGEYVDGELDKRYVNIIGNKIGHPANLDGNSHNGTGQVLLGHVRSVSPIAFAHPTNNTQPINNCDACTIGLDPEVAQATTGILGLTDKPLVVSDSWQGATIFKSGRTTGVTPLSASVTPTGTPTGNVLECKITSTTATISVNYCPGHGNTIQSQAVFKDCLLYSLSGELFSAPGDSGSVLLIQDSTDNNKLKLTGLHFAGSYEDVDADGIPDTPVISYGVGSRIQNVFDELNLTSWEGTIIAPSDANCIKVDGDCYSKSDSTFVRPTHRNIDETYIDCNKCIDD